MKNLIFIASIFFLSYSSIANAGIIPVGSGMMFCTTCSAKFSSGSPRHICNISCTKCGTPRTATHACFKGKVRKETPLHLPAKKNMGPGW